MRAWRGANQCKLAYKHFCPSRELNMFFYTLLFIVVAAVMALLGFTDMGGAASFMARVLFLACTMLAVLSIAFGRHIDAD
jgi:uncharacterized membrane protein YtjA (UPF0391 family)